MTHNAQRSALKNMRSINLKSEYVEDYNIIKKKQGSFFKINAQYIHKYTILYSQAQYQGQSKVFISRS